MKKQETIYIMSLQQMEKWNFENGVVVHNYIWHMLDGNIEAL